MSDASKNNPENHINRNPHGDFKTVEASRPDWDKTKEFAYSKTPAPNWSFGDGANDKTFANIPHIEIDPHAEGRPAVFNYKLLISAVIPRPIGFVSTRSKDGKSTNLAPFSYTQMVHHDPPMFVIGFSSSVEKAKDSLKNLVESGECVINMISEHFVEAANSTSINAPYGVSEWAISGLTPAPCTHVKASRVKEAVFSIEGKLHSFQEFDSKAKPGAKSGTMCVIEGVNFWAREDAVNADRNLIDPKVLKPMSRLGGITYGRTSEGMEITRPDWEKTLESKAIDGKVVPKVDAQL